MCRIFGVFGSEDINEACLLGSAQSMVHGGPDRQSYEFGPRWALGNDRLAIQGVAGGDQPFAHPAGVHAVFNGEIYNHRELREELRQHGHNFADDCDGNVLIPMFLRYGPDFVRRLDGMFAVAIVDMRERPSMHLFSDPAAVKSLYYHWDNAQKVLSFASEVEGLAKLTQAPLAVERQAAYDFLSLRAICGEQTIFSGVGTLGPSRHLHCKLDGQPEVATYQSLIIAPAPDPSLQVAGQQFQSLLDHEVDQMMRADVPVCVVTSGGLDSTLLSGLAVRHSGSLHSFHVCYKGDWPHDERRFAQEAADHFGTKHHDIVVDPDDFPALILKMTAHIGQPNTAPHSLSSYCLFQGISDAGFKVAITGEGADELFAGYERFSAALAPGDDWIEGYLDKFGPFPGVLRDEVVAADIRANANAGGSKIKEFAARILRTKPGSERLDALLALDQWERFPFYILRRADHLSMAHAVEMRVPFCQPRIMDFARQTPSEHRISEGKSKRVVYEAARGIIPQSILDRKKQPFTLPITAMIRADSKLFEFMHSVFSDRRFRERGFFDADKVLGYCKLQAISPRDDVANMLWSAMSFELWHRHIDAINLKVDPRRTLLPNPIGLQKKL